MNNIKKITAVQDECRELQFRDDTTAEERNVLSTLSNYLWKLNFHSNDVDKSQKLEIELASFLDQHAEMLQSSDNEELKDLLASARELTFSPKQEIEMLCERSTDIILVAMNDLNEAADQCNRENKQLSQYLNILGASINKNWPDNTLTAKLINKFQTYINDNMLDPQPKIEMLDRINESLYEKSKETSLGLIDSLQLKLAENIPSSEGLTMLADIQEEFAKLQHSHHSDQTREMIREITHQIKEFNNLDPEAHKGIAKKLMKTCEKISEVNQKTVSKDFDPKLRTTTPKFNK